MSKDQSKHSLFDASKLSADVLVQEYGRYFGINTACLRGGCLTDPGHAGAELQWFPLLPPQMRRAGKTYRGLGHGGKQVWDNIHRSVS